MIRAVTLPTFAALLAGSAVFAGAPGDAPPAPAAEASSITVAVTGGAWLPRLGGDVRLRPGTTIDADDRLELDDSETLFRGEVTIRKDDRWQLRFDGFEFSTDASTLFVGDADFGSLPLRDGDLVRSSLDLRSFSLELGRDVVVPLGPGADGAPSRAALRFTPKVGARYLDVEQSVELVGVGREEPEGEWLGVYGGLEMRVRFAPEEGIAIGRAIDLEAGIAAGPALGADGGFMWQVRADMGIELYPGARVTFGYRLLELDVEDDDFEFDAGLQGLFLSGTLTF